MSGWPRSSGVMPEPAASPFEQAVAVEPAGRGRYRAVVDPTWSGPVAPNGGVLAAIMVRATQTELGARAPAPRTIAAHYLDAPPPGPVEIAVEVLRRGKRVTACEVRMRAEDRLVCQATIVGSAAREQAFWLRRDPPLAPPPAAVPAVDGANVPGAPAIFGRVNFRPTFGPAIFSGGEEAVTGGWAAIGDDDCPLDAARLCALCDLWWPPLFGRLSRPAALPTLQLTVYLRDTTERVLPPVLARFTTTTIREGHLEERGELWSADGELVAESEQLALLVVS